MYEYKFKHPNVLDNTNQLHPDLMGLAISMLPWASNTSPSRMIMLASQISQALVTKALSRNRYFTGVEREMAKYTFAVRSDSDMEVIAVISKYRVGLGKNAIKQNPLKTVIVYDIENKQYDIIDIPTYRSEHNNFGWEYKPNEKAINRLTEGSSIKRGTILADSPGVMEDGRYVCSRLTNVISISDLYSTEDGILASNEWCEENISTGFLDLDIIPPKGYYWKNVYGTETSYKPFPGPGDKIRSDGLIAALGKHSDILGAIELTPEGLMEIDPYFDKCYYVEGSALNPRVADVDLINVEPHNLTINPVKTKEGDDIYNGIEDFWEQNINYHKRILDTYKEIRRTQHRWKHPKISEAFSRLLSTANMIVMPDHYYDEKGRRHNIKVPKNIRGKRRNTTIESQHLKIKIMYDVIPDMGHKFSGLYGNKGVICKKKPRSQMYRDKWGHVVDIVFDAYPIINRMIASWPFECTWNGFCRDFEERCREYNEEHPGELDKLYQDYLDFIKIAAPLHYEKEMEYKPSKQERDETIKRILDGDILDLYLPQHTPTIGVEMMAQLFDNFELRKDHLIIPFEDGTYTTTVDKHHVGQAAILSLEKTGHDYAAVDTPNRQAHGVPAKLTAQDKYSLPQRAMPQRKGEAENRDTMALIGSDFTADTIDRSNNPRALEAISYKLVSSSQPSNLYSVIDRTAIPIGMGLNRSYLENAIYVSGARYVFKDAREFDEK